MNIITTDMASQIPGLSQTIVTNGTVYLSGQTGTGAEYIYNINSK